MVPSRADVAQLVPHTLKGQRAMAVFHEAETPYKYALFVWCTYLVGCGFIRVQIGCLCATVYACATLGFVRLLERSADAASAAMVLRFCAFQNHLFLFMMMLYGKDAMKFLTNWSLFFHVQYFAFPRDRPALDGVARVVHATGFWAAYAVFFGFLTCAACGGAVPADVLLKARTEPATRLGVSSFIGWIHGGPTTVYVLDAVLSRAYLRRLYPRLADARDDVVRRRARDPVPLAQVLQGQVRDAQSLVHDGRAGLEHALEHEPPLVVVGFAASRAHDEEEDQGCPHAAVSQL